MRLGPFTAGFLVVFCVLHIGPWEGLVAYILLYAGCVLEIVAAIRNGIKKLRERRGVA